MDAEEKSFDYAADQVKQIITLASAIPALMITFSKDFVGSAFSEVRIYAYVSWGLFLVSIIFGLLSLMALTGTLARKANTGNSGDGVMTKNLRIFVAIQFIFFVIAFVFVIAYGLNVENRRSQEAIESPSCCNRLPCPIQSK